MEISGEIYNAKTLQKVNGVSYRELNACVSGLAQPPLSHAWQQPSELYQEKEDRTINNLK